jgi:hypothetical protein
MPLALRQTLATGAGISKLGFHLHFFLLITPATWYS